MIQDKKPDAVTTGTKQELTSDGSDEQTVFFAVKIIEILILSLKVSKPVASQKQQYRPLCI